MLGKISSALALSLAISARADPPPVVSSNLMSPFVVEGIRSKDPTTPFQFAAQQLHFGMLSYGWPGMNGPFALTPSRVPQAAEKVTFATSVLLEPSLRDPLAGSAQDASESPAGVLRSGQDARGKVLLDGIPLNRAYDGLADWRQAPREGLSRIEIVPEGGATAWGEGALAGVTQLVTEPNRGRVTVEPKQLPGAPPVKPELIHWEVKGAGEAFASLGSQGTRGVEGWAMQPAGLGNIQVLGGDFVSAGFVPVAAKDRGPIDRSAWDRHRWAEARWTEVLGKAQKLELTATVRGFEGFRGDGTPDQQEGTRDKSLLLSLSGHPNDRFAWNALAYGEFQTGTRETSFVTSGRAAEIPVADQWAIPASTQGIAWTAVWRQGSDINTVVGIDARELKGESREDGDYSGASFTRRLVAGGDQKVTGVFIARNQPVASGWQVDLGTRLDGWSGDGGHRRESDLQTGVTVSDAEYDSTYNAALIPSAGLVWHTAPHWRVRWDVQRSYRRPTLDQLYRTDSTENALTDPNPGLRPEFSTDWQLGLKYATEPLPAKKYGEPKPPATVVFGLTSFLRQGRETFARVTLDRPVGMFPLLGSGAPGELTRQWANLDRTQTAGLEAALAWHPAEGFSLESGAVVQKSVIQADRLDPALAGNRLPLAPDHILFLEATEQLPHQLSLRSRLRWLGPRFADPSNTLRIGQSAVTDLGLSRALTKSAELFLTLSNVGNVSAEIDRTAPDLVYVGAPRALLSGARFGW